MKRERGSVSLVEATLMATIGVALLVLALEFIHSAQSSSTQSVDPYSIETSDLIATPIVPNSQ